MRHSDETVDGGRVLSGLTEDMAAGFSFLFRNSWVRSASGNVFLLQMAFAPKLFPSGYEGGRAARAGVFVEPFIWSIKPCFEAAVCWPSH